MSARPTALLWAIVAIPLFYYFALIVGSLLYPGYSHVTQYASELGAAGARYPDIFNYGIIAAGVAAVIGGYGLYVALRTMTAASVLPALAGITLALWGVAMVIGGLFPMPDDRHGAMGLALVGQLTPLLVLLSVRRLPGFAAFKLFLALIFVGSTLLLMVMFGVGQLVTRSNVGLWQRAYSGSSIIWLAVLGLWLIRHGKTTASTAGAARLA